MPFPYFSNYHFSSSHSLPGAWSSAWSLPQQYRECEIGQDALEVAEIKRVGKDHESPSPNSVDLDCPEVLMNTVPPSNNTSMSRYKADPPVALLDTCLQETSKSLSVDSQSTLPSSPDDAISDCNTFAGEYLPLHSCPSFCSYHKLTPLAFESNLCLETLSLCRASVLDSSVNSPNSTSSQIFLCSSEPGDFNQETIHSCRKPTEIARPSFYNNALLSDTFLANPHETNFLEHVPKNTDTGRNDVSEFYPPLLLSQPDGNNTWTLSLDPTISRPETISESSQELESLSLLSSCPSDHEEDNEATAGIRGTLLSVHSTPRYDGSVVSLAPLQVGAHDIGELRTGSDVSMIVSSKSSVQQQHGEETISVPFSPENAFFNGHNFLLSTVQNSTQLSRSEKLVKKSKKIFGRLKRLFTPKGTISEGIQAHPPKSVTTKNPVDSTTQAGPRFLSPPSWSYYQRNRSTKSSTPSLAQSLSPEDTSHTESNVDEKYTYEYHARPKTLKEIKSQRRLSLPMAFVGTSTSRVTSSMKRNITTPTPRSRSRPMSMYMT